MRKYELLWKWICENGKDNFKLAFDEIENISGEKIDWSFLSCSYNAELFKYGYIIRKIYMRERIVEFLRIPNDIKISDKDDSLLVSSDNIFSVVLLNDSFLRVITDADTSRRKETLYDFNGKIIYEFYSSRSKVIFMGRELNTCISDSVVAYYPIKKQLLVCGNYLNKNGEKSKRSCIHIYDAEHKLVKAFDEPCDFEISMRHDILDIDRALKRYYIDKNSKFRLCGVRCKENDHVEIYTVIIPYICFL